MHFYLSSPKLATSICTVRYSFTVLNLGLGQTLHHSLEVTSVTIQVSMSSQPSEPKSCSRLFMFAKVQLLKSYGFPWCPYEYSYLSCSIFDTKRFRAVSQSPLHIPYRKSLCSGFLEVGIKLNDFFLKKRQTHVSLHQWAAPSTPSTTPKETFKPFADVGHWSLRQSGGSLGPGRGYVFG